MDCNGKNMDTATEWTPGEWPVLKEYDQDHLRRIALPLGGIGTGTISLGGRGELTDWEVANMPAVGFSPAMYGADAPGFLLYVGEPGERKSVTALEGPVLPDEYLDGEGRPFRHRGFPRFSNASFAAAYPFGQVKLEDDSLPVSVTVKGFNPFIPGDVDSSSLPVVVLSYEVQNKSDNDIEAAVCGHLRNFIGCDGTADKVYPSGTANCYRGMNRNRNAYREENGIKGIYFYSEGVAKDSTAWGTFALSTKAECVSYRTAFSSKVWYSSTVELNDDFGADGILKLASPDPGKENDPVGALAVKKVIPAHGKASFTFYFTWSFPNRRDWSGRQIVGNYYTSLYPDAWTAARKILPMMPELESKTIAFVQAFLSSSADDALKEAALFNLATLRSPTVFRLPSGHLMGWEGVCNHVGSCQGSCTHVWNYEQATAYLFPELARTMRDVEFNYSTADDGSMAFRTNLPLADARKGAERAADGQMGTVMKAYREWRISGDRAFLDSVWPNVKKAMAYAWTGENAWDADRDGMMEGPQGNTMDVEYWGPNPQMAFWYLGALKACAAMAREEGDIKFAEECDALFANGSKLVDRLIFNGEYYEQKLPAEKSGEGFQLGEGCLVDQLVGQTMAHQLGFGFLAEEKNIRKAAESIAKYNYVPDFGREFNPLRAYAMAGDAGLVMASWPHGFHKDPFPYYSEAMTGFEYVAASEMYWLGMDDLALRTVRDIRARHDGARRNPFSEPEAGHHYARSMASWGTYLAWSGFRYDAVTGQKSFSTRPGRYFWCVGKDFGVVENSH